MDKVIIPIKNKQKDLNSGIEFYTNEEMDEIANILKENIHLYTITQLLRYTGLRISEALAVSIDDIDFENREIKISKAIKKVPKNKYVESLKVKDVIGGTKTGKTRYIPLKQDLATDIERYIKATDQDESLKSHRVRLNNLLFINERSGLENKDRVLDKIQYKLKVEGCKIKYGNHKYRHTFATTMISKGLEVNGVSELLGHGDITTTLKYYVGVDERTKEKGRSLIDQL